MVTTASEIANAAPAEVAEKTNGTRLGTRTGLRLQRHFTRTGVHPYSEVEWETRPAKILSENGKVVFEQNDVEVPKFWSQMATNVVASKYFRGSLDSSQRERSVRQLIGRVVNTITGWGRADGYFATEEDAETFAHELTYLLLGRSDPGKVHP